MGTYRGRRASTGGRVGWRCGGRTPTRSGSSSSPLRAGPEDQTTRSELALAYPWLGREADATREVESAARRRSGDLNRENSARYTAAEVYTTLGRGRCLSHLEHLLSVPSFISVPGLRVDPTWASLRSHPRFQRLVDGKGSP